MNRVQTYWPLFASPTFTFKLKKLYDTDKYWCLVDTQTKYHYNDSNNHPYSIVRQDGDFRSFYLCIKNSLLTLSTGLTLQTVKTLIDTSLNYRSFGDLYLLLTFKRNDGVMMGQRQDIDVKKIQKKIGPCYSLFFEMLNPIELEDNASYFDLTHTYKLSIEFYLY